ncbi:hypothetical protein [Streptomyces exfoliatus]|uniref:hypothetical protein n=1 Tax=Streptomyces exfoliatus TaxID=1905 RepID=UPI00378A8C8D
MAVRLFRVAERPVLGEAVRCTDEIAGLGLVLVGESGFGEGWVPVDLGQVPAHGDDPYVDGMVDAGVIVVIGQCVEVIPRLGALLEALARAVWRGSARAR